MSRLQLAFAVLVAVSIPIMAIALTPASITPGQALPPANIYGLGAVSCGTWTKLSTTDPAGQAWVEGYVTAWSLAGAVVPGGKPLETTDSNAIRGFVDAYCKEHPLDPVRTAAYQLVLELIKRYQK